MLEALTRQVNDRADLTPGQAAAAVAELVKEQVAAETKADFLAGLGRKGETVAEITAFATELRARAVEPPIDPATRARGILDVCGTGGDRLNTFNISTTVALIAAAAGVPVAKHGNRAITSQCGSADVLEALGIPIELAPDEAARWLREHHFAFFFAPKYHPAFKHIAPARKLCAARGLRTLFNCLGPLINPARPSAQLIGVPDPARCEPMARVLQSLGIQRGLVVSGRVPQGCLDEFSPLGDNETAEFAGAGAVRRATVPPGELPIRPAALADLAGGDLTENARIVRRILGGEESGPKRDAVLLNAAGALYVAGKAGTLREGWDQAADLIDSGRALAKLDELIRAGTPR